MLLKETGSCFCTVGLEALVRAIAVGERQVMEDRGDIDDLTIEGHRPLLREEFCKPVRSMDMVNERLRVHIFGKCAGLACQVRVRGGDPTDGDGCAHKSSLPA